MDTCPDTIKRLLQQHQSLRQVAEHLVAGLATLERDLAQLFNSASGETHADAPISPCLNCIHRDSCTSPCDVLKSLLPGIDSGRKATVAMPLNILQPEDDQRAHQRASFSAFKCIRADLLPPQWELVCLLYRDGLTQSEAAKRLGRSPSTISERHKLLVSKLHQNIKVRSLETLGIDRLSRLLTKHGLEGLALLLPELRDPNSTEPSRSYPNQTA